MLTEAQKEQLELASIWYLEDAKRTLMQAETAFKMSANQIRRHMMQHHRDAYKEKVSTRQFKRLLINCAFCNKSFEVTPSRAKTALYCGGQCYDMARRSTMSIALYRSNQARTGKHLKKRKERLEKEHSIHPTKINRSQRAKSPEQVEYCKLYREKYLQICKHFGHDSKAANALLADYPEPIY